jgi:hypothetical protein
LVHQGLRHSGFEGSQSPSGSTDIIGRSLTPITLLILGPLKEALVEQVKAADFDVIVVGGGERLCPVQIDGAGDSK